MTSSTIPKQEIKDLLAKNETLRAIEILRTSPSIQGDQENSRMVDLQSSRYHQVEAAYHKGTLSWQERNTEGQRLSDALLQLINQLSEEALAVELPPLPASLKRPEHPFTGLHWFTREDAPVFFGRGQDIRDLYDYIIEGERLILLYGQSGAGKSSLLHAGLLPRLEHAWQAVYCRRDRERGLPDQLRDILRQPAEGKQLIILDQVEEILTNPNPLHEEEGESLAALLDKALAAGGPRSFVLGFRKEFLAEVNAWLKPCANLDPVEKFLRPLDRPGILEAVAGVSKSRELRRKYKNLQVEEDLPGQIAGDILRDQQSHQAPLLQLLLRKMWDEVSGLPGDAVFSRALYDRVRRDSLGGMLDGQLSLLAARFPQEVEGGLALDVLAFYTSSGALVTSRGRSDADLTAAYRHLPGILELKHALTALFLLTEDSDAQSPGSRLAHDSLATLVMERLRASNQSGPRARRILESKHHDIAQGGVSFKDADDIAALEAGRPFMREWSPEEAAALESGKEALARQLAREAAIQRSNLDFAKARIGEAIHRLDYDLAFSETLRALDLNHGQEELALLLEEIAFVHETCGQHGRALEVLGALSSLRLSRYALLAEALPGLQQRPGSRVLEELLSRIPGGAWALLRSRYLPEMIPVPGGSFRMGSDSIENAKPHSVTLDGFHIQRTPVTYWQYHLFLVDTGLACEKPGWGRLGDHPAVYVNWYDAVRYCNWLNAREGLPGIYDIQGDEVSADWAGRGYRLPTEAEWEYAARGGPAQQPFAYSGSDKVGEVAWYRDNSENRTQAVTQKQPNALGLHDMSGNVWEWCWDWYGKDYYEDGQVNPRGAESGADRVLRGSSWNYTARCCRSSGRSRFNPDDRNDSYGFRLVLLP